MKRKKLIREKFARILKLVRLRKKDLRKLGDL